MGEDRVLPNVPCGIGPFCFDCLFHIRKINPPLTSKTTAPVPRDSIIVLMPVSPVSCGCCLMCEVSVVIGVALLGVVGTRVAVAATGVIVNVAGVGISVIAGSAGDIVFIRCNCGVWVACGRGVGIAVGVGVRSVVEAGVVIVVGVEVEVGVGAGVGVEVGVGVGVGLSRQDGSGLHNKVAA
jgi:hypothetical protein